MQQAVKWQLLARNPTEAVEPPRPQRKEMQVVDEAGTARLLQAVEGMRLYMPVLLAVMTGMRRGEIKRKSIWSHKRRVGHFESNRETTKLDVIQ